MHTKWIATVLTSLTVVALQPRAASASPILIDLNTSSLTTAPGSSNGPFSLFFQFTDGSGLGNGNNTVTLDHFLFGGGSATAGADLFGGAAGDLDSSVVLTDTSFFNGFNQGFTPGSSLSFQVHFSTNVEAGGVPDAFAFSILDSLGFPLATLDPTFADTLLTMNIDSSSPAVLAYGTDPTRTDVALNPPTVQSVPEPGTLVLVGGGWAMFMVRRRLRAYRT